MKPLACILLAALAACTSAAKLCSSDKQCAPGFSCDETTGACGCSGDSSCGSAESCNVAGFCQARLRCDSSADCTAGNICDTISGSCIVQGSCSTLDTQCVAGQVCQGSACVPGCRHDGDCPAPSDICSPCPSGTPAAECPTGNVCVRGQCDTKLTCNYGDLCQPQSSTVSVCAADARGPFCQPCVEQAATTGFCPGADGFGNGNYCLIDGSQPLGRSFFCGVDCSQGQDCPFGYTCHDVREVSGVNCDPTAGLAACQNINLKVTCDPAKSHAGTQGGVVNDDCDAASLLGAVCDPNNRQCVPQCVGTGETGVQSFCSCTRDSDCPKDTCDSTTHSCIISGQFCDPNVQPDSCNAEHAIHCAKEVDSRLGEIGYCRIGQNCAPDQGFTCAILLGQ
jgi:hypothetical protein